MPERNFKMDTLCTICNTPFDVESEGFEGDLNTIPVRICGSCFDGMESVVEANVPHTVIECPHCEKPIGLRVEVVSEP